MDNLATSGNSSAAARNIENTVAVLQQQRNNAMDTVVNLEVLKRSLERQIEELETKNKTLQDQFVAAAQDSAATLAEKEQEIKDKQHAIVALEASVDNAVKLAKAYQEFVDSIPKDKRRPFLTKFKAAKPEQYNLIKDLLS